MSKEKKVLDFIKILNYNKLYTLKSGSDPYIYISIYKI